MGNQNPEMNLRLRDPLTRKQLDRLDLKQDHNRTSLSRNRSNQHDPHQEPLRNNLLKNRTGHPGLNQEVLQKGLTKKHTETQNLIQIQLRTGPIKKLSGLQGRKKDDLMMTLTKRSLLNLPDLNQEALQKDLTKKHTKALIKRNLMVNPDPKQGILPGSHSAKESS